MPRLLPMFKEKAPERPRETPRFERKPAWLKVRAPGGERFSALKGLVQELGLHTVCQEASCPNIGECWNGGTLTLMLLGDVCTRACKFCHIHTGKRPEPADPEEPEKVAEAVGSLGLDYVVLTMVDRDDMPDGGADHVARTVEAIKRRDANVLVEVLTGDFQGVAADIDRVAASGADVLAHNIETVARLQKTVRDARCTYERSLGVLRRFRATRPDAITKSSIMLGVGEEPGEVEEAMADLRAHEVEILTIGQYLRPSAWHLEVKGYATPETFADLERKAKAIGFAFCASGPLVRSSYRAGELFLKSELARRKGRNVTEIGA